MGFPIGWPHSIAFPFLDDAAPVFKMACALLEGPSDAAYAWLQGEVGSLGTDLPSCSVMYMAQVEQELGKSWERTSLFPTHQGQDGPMIRTTRVLSSTARIWPSVKP